MNKLDPYMGNPAAYARQYVKDGKSQYVPVRERWDGRAEGRHLSGLDTYGTYVLALDKARFIVFDIDDSSLNTAQALKKEAAQSFGLNAGVEFSGNKGYHVWILFDQWHSGADVMRLAKHIASKVGFSGEVFPKQAVARDLGNLVKLPFGVHQKTKQRSRFIGPEPQLNNRTAFEQAMKQVPAAAPVPVGQGNGKGYHCVDSIMLDPPKEGERNNLLFHLGTHLHRANLPEPVIEAVMEQLVDDPEFAAKELPRIIENSGRVGITCDQLGPDRHCPPGQCAKDWMNGLSAGLLRNAGDGQVVKLRVTGRRASPDGRSMKLDVEHPDGRGTVVVDGPDGN